MFDAIKAFVNRYYAKQKISISKKSIIAVIFEGTTCAQKLEFLARFQQVFHLVTAIKDPKLLEALEKLQQFSRIAFQTVICNQQKK